jgi:hypothetical protein
MSEFLGVKLRNQFEVLNSSLQNLSKNLLKRKKKNFIYWEYKCK